MMKKVLLLNLLCFAFFSVFAQTQVGRTTYDLQTNNANCRRVATNAAGEVVITYTKSLTNSEAAPDRGTGYNYKSAAGVWSETNFPASGFTRFDIGRTGWSNVGFLANGDEVIIAHFADDLTFIFCLWLHVIVLVFPLRLDHQCLLPYPQQALA